MSTKEEMELEGRVIPMTLEELKEKLKNET
jgi:hypothetical protein